jgi:hypothetical protein
MENHVHENEINDFLDIALEKSITSPLNVSIKSNKFIEIEIEKFGRSILENCDKIVA